MREEYNPEVDSEIVIGRFIKQGDEYIRAEGDLVYPLGEDTFTWCRHVEKDSCRKNPEEHEHYNGAKNARYMDGKYEWSEMGPEHSQEEIDERLNSDEPGVTKWANWTEYFPEDHGDFGTYYLQIVKVQ